MGVGGVAVAVDAVEMEDERECVLVVLSLLTLRRTRRGGRLLGLLSDAVAESPAMVLHRRRVVDAMLVSEAEYPWERCRCVERDGWTGAGGVISRLS